MKVTYQLELMQNFTPKMKLPQKFNNSKRNNEFYLSRFTLAKLVQQAENFHKIDLKNHQFLSDFPLDIFSLAHTRGAALAVRAPKSCYLALGCDIEHLERDIPPNSQKHFLNQEDRHASYELLTLWCIKEACFKALHNAGKPIRLLKEVVLLGHHFKYAKDSELNPNFCFEVLTKSGHLIVLAYCLKHED